ncbi:hypothetical protein BT63DRAFT_131537 [Microthyrium microscopicum]|uniref:Uncharacterized protein n=1 Tax=Microthyrium microscopicum TaxID=703497 RepID=A0A6A6UJZ8_9PEZI|nr:hypothetical protein BT63DRAFT_131537 [Microthyrium microscopicum]
MPRPAVVHNHYLLPLSLYDRLIAANPRLPLLFSVPCYDFIKVRLGSGASSEEQQGESCVSTLFVVPFPFGSSDWLHVMGSCAADKAEAELIFKLWEQERHVVACQLLSEFFPKYLLCCFLELFIENESSDGRYNIPYLEVLVRPNASDGILPSIMSAY